MVSWQNKLLKNDFGTFLEKENDKKIKDTKAYKQNNNNPTDSKAVSANMVNDKVREGDVGIRNTLLKYGADNNKIGYRNEGGNGIVTYDGKDLLRANAVKDGVSYASENDVKNAYNKVMGTLGNDIVRIRDYVANKRAGANIGFNEGSGEVSIDGYSIKPSYIENGVAYAPRSDIDSILNKSDIKSYSDIYKNNEDESGYLLKEILRKVNNPDKFSYNEYVDPVYRAYEKMLEREAQKNIEDMVAAYSAQNGGLATSAGITAAAMAGGNLRQKLTDILPTLYQEAYQRFANDRNYETDMALKAYDLYQQKLNNELNLNKLMLDDKRTDDQISRALIKEADEEAWTDKQRGWEEKERNFEYDNALKQQALNDAVTRGYFTPYEANLLGVDVNSRPFDVMYSPQMQMSIFNYNLQNGLLGGIYPNPINAASGVNPGAAPETNSYNPFNFDFRPKDVNAEFLALEEIPEGTMAYKPQEENETPVPVMTSNSAVPDDLWNRIFTSDKDNLIRRETSYHKTPIEENKVYKPAYTPTNPSTPVVEEQKEEGGAGKNLYEYDFTPNPFKEKAKDKTQIIKDIYMNTPNQAYADYLIYGQYGFSPDDVAKALSN